MADHPFKSAYLDAIESNDMRYFRSLLPIVNVDLGFDDYFIMRTIALYGRTEMLNLLLEREGIDPTIHAHTVFAIAMRKGFVDTAVALLEDPRIEPPMIRSLTLEYNNPELIKALLLKEFFDPSMENNLILRSAIAKGHAETALLLLKDLRIDPSVDQQFPLRAAVENNLVDVVRALLLDKRVDVSIYEQAPLRLAAKEGYADIVELLLPYADATANKHEAIQLAARGGHMEVVNLLLPYSDPSVNNQYALKYAVFGLHENTAKLLIQDERVDFQVQHNLPLRASCLFGLKSLVEMLLKKGADPTAVENFCMMAASGNLDILKLLKEDGRADLSVGNNLALRLAIKEHNEEIAKFALEDERVRQADLSEPLKLAALHGETYAVEKLLEIDVVNPLHEGAAAVELAAKGHYKDILKLMIADEHLDDAHVMQFSFLLAILEHDIETFRMLVHANPTFVDIYEQLPILLASETGFTEAVKELLLFPSVKPETNDNLALQHVAMAGHAEILKLLLSQPHVDPAANHYEALKIAAYLGHLEVVRVLIEDGRSPIDVQGNFPLTWAIINNHIGVTKYLLSLEEINPLAYTALKSAYVAEAKDHRDRLQREASPDIAVLVKEASDMGNTDTLKLLFDDPRVTVHFQNNLLLREACRYGHAKTVELLLTYKEINVNAADGYPLMLASAFGKTEVVKVLLRAPNIDPIAKGAWALMQAGKRGHPEVVEVFIADKHFQNEDYKQELQVILKQAEQVKIDRIEAEQKSADAESDTVYELSGDPEVAQFLFNLLIEELMQPEEVVDNEIEVNEDTSAQEIEAMHATLSDAQTHIMM